MSSVLFEVVVTIEFISSHAGAMTNSGRAGVFSSRHAGTRGNFVYANSSSKLSRFGFHINREGKISNKANFRGLRLALNGHTGYTTNIRYGTPTYTTGNYGNCGGNSFMNTLCNIQQLMMMTQQLGQMFGLNSSKVNPGANPDDGGGVTPTPVNTSSMTSLSSSLKNASSFSDISNLETRANNQKTTALTGYKELNKDLTTNIEPNILDGLKKRGLNTDSINLTDISNETNLETAISSIDNDINNIQTQFVPNISEVRTSLSQYKQTLQSQLNNPNYQSQQSQLRI